jgi:hypothetical protein
MKDANAGSRVVRSDPVTVSGFPGREVVIDAPGEGRAIARVVVAETRLYIAVSGGRFADPDGERARRFLDSFEITDPRLVARAKDRGAGRVAKEADARRAAEAAKQAEADAKRRNEERLAALKKAEEERLAAEKKRQEEALVAEARKREEERLAAIRRAEEKRLAEEKARREAEERRLAREKAEREADEKDRLDAEAFRTVKYAGPPVPDPNTLPGLELYLSFDDAGGGKAVAAPSGQALTLPRTAAAAPGVRGQCLHLPQSCDGIEIPATILPRATMMPSTITAWVRVRSTARVGVFDTARRPAAPSFSLSVTGGRLVAVPNLRPNVGLPGEAVAGVLTAWWPADARWHHVALVRDTEPRTLTPQRLILYLDGKPVRTAEGNYATFLPGPLTGGTTGQVGIVRVPNPAGALDREWAPAGAARHPDRLAAAIDEVCVYDRPLVEKEIRYLAGREAAVPTDLDRPPPVAPVPRSVAPAYRGGPVPPATDFPGLKFYLTLDDAGGDTLTDAVSGKVAGTVDGGLRTDGVRGGALRVLPFRPNAGKVPGVLLTGPKDALRVEAGKPFTMAVWARAPDLRFAGVTPIFGSSPGVPQQERRLSFRLSPRTAEVTFLPSERRGGTLYPIVVRQNLTDEDRWHHFALTRNEAGLLRLLVDGRERVPQQPRPRYTGEIGYETFGLAGPVAGLAVDLDEFCIFDRELSDDELRRLAGRGAEADRALLLAPPPRRGTDLLPYAGRPVPAATDFPGLKLYLACDELTGGALVEAVGKKTVGSLEGGELVDGVRGKALRLSHDERVRHGKPAVDLSDLRDDFHVPANGPFTLALWVRQVVPSPRLSTRALGAGAGTQPVSRWLNLDVMAGSATLLLGERGAAKGRVVNVPFSEKTAPLGTWYHLALVRDEKGEVRCLVNGVESGPGRARQFPGELRYDTLGLVQSFEGRAVVDVDELCLFDRALAAAELRKLAGRP